MISNTRWVPWRSPTVPRARPHLPALRGLGVRLGGPQRSPHAPWTRGAEAGESPVWSAGATSEATACGAARAEGPCRGPPASFRPTASRAPGAPIRFSPRRPRLLGSPPSPGRPRVQPRPRTGAVSRGRSSAWCCHFPGVPRARQFFPPQTYPSGLTRFLALKVFSTEQASCEDLHQALGSVERATPRVAVPAESRPCPAEPLPETWPVPSVRAELPGDFGVYHFRAHPTSLSSCRWLLVSSEAVCPVWAGTPSPEIESLAPPTSPPAAPQ